MITIETVGRRHYLRGNTYPVKDQLRAAGCKWDRDQSAWYTGKRDLAEQLASGGIEAPATYAPVEGEGTVEVGGNTYPVRDQLRALGGQWDAGSKSWRVPTSKAVEAQALVANAPKPTFRRGSGARRSGGGRCRGCGGPIVNARHHRAMGGYCGSCAFDEYDC